MLSSSAKLARRARSLQQTAPQLASVYLEQSRGVQLFDIFDKSKAKERQEKLKEEVSRGYWDDFKEFKDSQGKLFAASQSLQPKETAPNLPEAQILDSEGSKFWLRSVAGEHAATLLCVAFRSGAEDMLASWSGPFGVEFANENAGHCELSIVESVVMSWWPFRAMILRGRSADAEQTGLKPRYLFSFGDATPFLEAMQLSNRLTGYTFLVDSAGRLRWRGSGAASAEELRNFLGAARQLLDEEKT